MITILMTGAGAPGGPGVLKCLKKCNNYKIITADANEFSSGKFLSENFEKIPYAHNSNFIDEVMKICVKHKVDVIFPLVTKELFLFSKNIHRFLKENIKVIVSNIKNLSIANNKSLLYKHLDTNGVKVPEYRVVNKFVDFVKVTESVFSKNGYCIKPSISNGSRGVRIVKNNVDEKDLLLNHKPNNIYTTHENLKRILSNDNFPELLISEILPGIEYTIDTIIHKNKPIIILPRIRSKTNSGISVSGSFVKNKEIINYCKNIINTMVLDGPIGIQVKQNSKGQYRILEINPRIQGTSVTAIGCGINLPVLCVELALENKIDIPNIKWNTSFIRFYDEVYFNYNYFLIDFDDTLFSEKIICIQHHEISKYINEKYKLKISHIYQFLIDEFEISGRKNLFDKLNSKFEIPSIEINIYLKILRNLKLKNKIRLYDKSYQLLEKIIKQNKNFIIVTNGNVKQQRNKVSLIDWRQISNPYILYANKYFPKPDKRLFYEVIKPRFNMKKSEILFIGILQ